MALYEHRISKTAKSLLSVGRRIDFEGGLRRNRCHLAVNESASSAVIGLAAWVGCGINKVPPNTIEEVSNETF
jgi:hypothetical protein